MKIKKTPEIHKELSTILPVIGGIILMFVIPALEAGIELQIIPEQYHATITGTVIVALGFIGKKIYQPGLKRNQVNTSEDQK